MWLLSLQLLVIAFVCSHCFRARIGVAMRPVSFRHARVCLEDFDAEDDEVLRTRISQLQEKDACEETRSQIELLQRIEDLRAADEAEETLYLDGNIVEMPVVCYDGLLPKQCLELDTTDPVFSNFLNELGLGGLFVMVAFDGKRRKLRRHGVIVRISSVDAMRGAKLPTAVRACLLGRARVCVLGNPTEMVSRVGRYRRGYDEDGERRALGWGLERFVDATSAHAAKLKNMKAEIPPNAIDGALSSREWQDLPVQLILEDGETVPGVQNLTFANVQSETTAEETKFGELLVAALDRWRELASDPRTYDNVNVVARSRARHGHPGLRVDPKRLVENVLQNLGPMPSTSQPTALALWAAALANPVPPLGVSPEMRAAILEAPTALRRLEMVLNGVRRSILNLEGEVPL